MANYYLINEADTNTAIQLTYPLPFFFSFFFFGGGNRFNALLSYGQRGGEGGGVLVLPSPCEVQVAVSLMLLEDTAHKRMLTWNRNPGPKTKRRKTQ